MPPFGPTSRAELIRVLILLGFSGPYSGGKHQFMVKNTLKLTVPNPHTGQIDISLLSRILRQAGISRKQWESV